MKRKDDAEERKQSEQVLQKSMERSHWTTTSNSNETNSDDPMTGNENKIKFIVEYDNSSSGINTVVSGSANCTVGRIHYGKKAEAKKEKDNEEKEEEYSVEKGGKNKSPKIPKLK